MNYIYKYWAKAGGLSGIGILIILPFTSLNFPEIEYLLWIQFSLLLIHQFEEYIYPGGFKNFYNLYIYNKSRITAYPLTNKAVFMINVNLAWAAYFFTALFNIKILWFVTGVLLITMSNGILHTVLAFVMRRYNPGLITGLFLFIPFGVYTFMEIEDKLSMADMGLGIIVFLLGSLMIPVIIYLSDKLK